MHFCYELSQRYRLCPASQSGPQLTVCNTYSRAGILIFEWCKYLYISYEALRYENKIYILLEFKIDIVNN